jgi:phage tail sheath protein FI
MPLISAGVNSREIDLTAIIPSVPTSEGAFAGHFRWGPVLKRVLIDSEDSLVATFGKPNTNTASDFFVASSFLDYANKLYTVRVVNANTAGGNLGAAHARNAISNAANTKNTVIKNDEDYDLNYSSGGISGVGAWVAKYPGELGNSLRVSVCATANAYESTLTGTIAFTNNSTTITGTGTQFSNQLTVGDILLAGPDKIQLKVGAVTNATSATLQSKYIGNTAAGLTTTRRWEFHGQFDRAPGTSDFASRVGGSSDEMHIVVADEDGWFTGIANNVIERFAAVSKASDAIKSTGDGNYYKTVINYQSEYVWWASAPSGITNIGVPAAGKSFGVGAQSKPINASLTLGRDGASPQESQYIFGMNEFADPEEVDISFMITGEGSLTRALHAINNIAEKRKDCLAVVGPLRASVVNNSNYYNKEAADLVTHRNNLPSSSYATMDSGYKYTYDKFNDVYRYVATNGDIAGLMARTDEVADVWNSPAGYNRGQIKNAIKLAFNPNQAARDELYKNGINPVVQMPGKGTVLFGDKTLLTKPSAFDRINVRRLFIVLRKSISKAAEYMLFENNTVYTRAGFRNMVEPFLRDIQGRGGIYDFRVICDETNNTPVVIDRNEFIGTIMVKPVRSINFITLNFVAVATGVDFSEVSGGF